jgi:hypothetical protein
VKTDANKEMLAEMKTNQAGILVARMEVKTHVNLMETKEAIQTNQEEMKDKIRANQAKADTTLKEME